MDIEDVLKEHNVPYKRHGEHHHASAGWLQIDCPYCSPNTNSFRMGINAKSKAVNCYICGRQSLIQTLIDILVVPFFESRRIANSLFLNKEYRDHSSNKERGTLKLPKGRTELLPAHRKYLKKRKFDPDKLIELWGLQGIGIAAKFGWSIFIPFEFKGNVVSFSTRKITDEVKARYISAKPEEESVALKDLLYGEDHCQHTCIVHEGPTDVWATGPGAVAICGLTVSPTQLNKLTTYPVRVICFDSEVQAQRRARALRKALGESSGTTIIIELKTGNDAASASKKEIKELRKFLD